MMTHRFRLSPGSRRKLKGVDARLRTVVNRALAITDIDFSVIDGVRTIDEQRDYFNNGLSHTMDSRHLTGHAVDLAPWHNGASSFDDDHMFIVAQAMRDAAGVSGVPLRWGGAWHIHDITQHELMTPKFMNDDYNRIRKSQGRDAFNDLPHFEIPA